MPTQYRYVREAFGELPVTLHHLTMHINFLDRVVEASNCLEMEAKTALDSIHLDANGLDILKVEWVGDEPGPGKNLPYEYLRDENRLTVHLGRTVQPGVRFKVRTLTRCVPSDHILEGLYTDITPPGAPQQYMSQCQQWGFQRIMPIFDDCRAKCAMTTTIEADARYTHLISNGNISRNTNPDGKPVPKPGDPSRQVITYENHIPMAPYLFLVCVGTWEALVDHVAYPSGKTVRLEYLVPPGRVEGARVPMEILKRAILWIGETQDYEYTGDTYRTICMSKSNFGGMENVGNTTIVTDAALIDWHTLDQGLLYSHAVIVHEFEHNQCGSETTMENPFDIWLNEAYTVDVERRFMADVFDPAFIRLEQVESIRNPLLGPLAIEDGGRVGRILREGFDEPDQLVDGVTYVKAAEVIRMLRLVLGDEHFLAGKRLYFSRYRHGNANSEQFFKCFEEVSGRSLEQFKNGWLNTMGYPRVTARTDWDPQTRTFHIALQQETNPGLEPFHLPVEAALVDGDGRTIPGTGRTLELRDQESRLELNDVAGIPAFASLNRGFSFYGTFSQEGISAETLALQARLDPDMCNRVEAMRRLTDVQRIRLLNDPDAGVDDSWIELYGRMLGDENLSPGLKAYFLRIDEQPLDRAYCTWFPELVTARDRLMLAVNRVFRDRLKVAFARLDTYTPRKVPNEGIEDRVLKHVLLDLLTIDDSPDSHRMILEHFQAATTSTDKVSALLALNRSSSKLRGPVLDETFRAWHEHLSGYANYLRIVGRGTLPHVFEAVEAEKLRSTFDITQPTWSRALFISLATNNRVIWTDQGINWLTATIVDMTAINPYTTGRLLNAFQHVGRLRAPLREKVRHALEQITKQVPHETCAPIHSQAASYLGT
ncbi:MAG: M1 family metallopeptidase [Thermodesulfobacteriota bacterium]